MEKKFRIRNFLWLIMPAIAVCIFLLTVFLAKNPGFTEQVYSRSIYPVLASILSSFSNLFPFSLDDLFYFTLLVLPFLFVVLILREKVKLKTFGKVVVNVLAAIYVMFYLFWGFNYFREDLNSRLNLAEQTADTTRFYQVFDALIQMANQTAHYKEQHSVVAVDSMLEESYKNLAPVLHISYPMGKRKDKKITLSRFFAKAGISGYFGPFFNEVHVNKKVLPIEYPFVLAHEKAHQFGITGEAEANFYAWLVCTQSTSEFIQYSANLALLNHFMVQGQKLDGFSERIKKPDNRVKDDLTNIWKHWQELRNEKIDKAAGKANDAYLKANKIEKGIDDYRGVVKYVMDFSLDTAFQQKHAIHPF